MLRLRHLFCAIFLSAVSASGQSCPEADALMEAFFAKDIDTVVRHLPPEWDKFLADLNETERRTIAKKLLLAQSAAEEGVTFTPSQSADTLAAMEIKRGDEPIGKAEVVLDRRISNGYETALRLKMRKLEPADGRDGVLDFTMRFEEGDWRVYEIRPLNSSDTLKFSDSDFLEQLRNSVLSDNEREAMIAMRSYADTCSVYSMLYSDVGFPASLDVLGGREEIDEEDASVTSVNGTSARARLLDSSLTTPPFEKAGYRFTYHVQNSGNEESGFSVVATPMDFGRSGRINFYIDQTRTLRYTREDRESTKEDRQFESGPPY